MSTLRVISDASQKRVAVCGRFCEASRIALLPYAQLVRLPNVFTAFADIGMAWAAVWALAPTTGWSAFPLLMAASGCLYMAGMVWNDFFDLEEDRRERPERPLPSGRIRRYVAALLGIVLLAAGLGLAGLAGAQAEEWSPRPLTVASILAVAVLAYDSLAKHVWLGPLVMGSCRFLNVLLGLSVAEHLGGVGWHLASIVGLYIVGVTWFAKTEAQTSSRPALSGAATVMLAALVLAISLPVWLPPKTSSVFFPYLVVGFGFVVGLPVSQAIQNPSPMYVQAAVKRAILGLILLDATLATAFVGLAGLGLILLFFPAQWLGRWVYST